MLKLLPMAALVVAIASSRAIAETQFQFASLEEGQALVATPDPFLKALSRFDRQVRLQTDGDATEASLVEFLKQQVLDWDQPSRRRVTDSLDRLRPKLDPFHLPLPPTTLFVQVSGKDESNAAYTRGTAILLPRDRLQKLTPEALDRLVLHELFHVLSRNAPDLRRDLYGIIGFEVCDPIPLPPSLVEIKLTNPDAPLIDCAIKLTEDEGSFHATPVLFSSSPTYDAQAKPSLFKYLTFRLMKVERHEGKWRPLLSGGEPILVQPGQCRSFSEQIGRNTNYTIHPDEILADNFVHLVLETGNLASPEIVERMGERLRQPR